MAETTWQDAKALGNSEYTAGRVDSAVEHYTKALSFPDLPSSDRATILCNRAQAYLKVGKHAEAAEDCTACLTISPDNVKALFRRAAAFEALGEKKDALGDYRRVLTLSPGVSDAIQAVKRLEKDLGIDKRQAAMNKITEEDARQLDETKQRVKEVALQKARAKDQQVSGMREKRSLELTLGQVKALPETIKTYRPVGKMFLMTERSELTSSLTDKLGKTEHKLKVCASALEHIERQEKEADSAFLEVMDSIRKKQSRSS